MPIADYFENFVPEAELPIRPLHSSLHAGYAAMAQRRRAGLILFDDTDPAYLVTDDFIHIALLIEAGLIEAGSIKAALDSARP